MRIDPTTKKTQVVLDDAATAEKFGNTVTLSNFPTLITVSNGTLYYTVKGELRTLALDLPSQS